MLQRRAFPQRHRPSPPAVRPGRRGFPSARFLLFLVLSAAGVFTVYKTASLISRAPEQETKRIIDSPITEQEWQDMVAGLQKESRSYRGLVSIFIKDLETGRTWEYEPDRPLPSASLIKVPIMAAVMEKVRAGSLSLNTQIKLTRGYRVGGSGSLKWVRDGTSLSVMEIIYKMITESDNTAAKMLIDQVGMDYLNSAFSGMGLSRTNITPEGMSLTSGPVLRENYTTAREMAMLMERIYEKKLVDGKSSEFMLEALKNTKSRSRLRRGLPMGWEIGHKTGLLRRSCHDVGIVFSPRGDYVIAVLTSKVPSYSSAKVFISRVARLTYKYYRVDSDYAGMPAQGRGGGPGRVSG